MSDIPNVHVLSGAPNVRAAPRSREQMEKAMLAARREQHQRHDPAAIASPLSVQPSAKGMHLPDAQRFHSDTAGEAKRERDNKAAQEAARLAQRRDNNLAREEKRWVDMSAQAQADADRLESKRASGLAAKKNASSLPVNLISLEYRTDRAGSLLAHQDSMVKYRSALRTQHLYDRGNSAYNPITGAPKLEVAPPAKPQTPMQR